MIKEELRDYIWTEYGNDVVFFDNPSFDDSIVSIDIGSTRLIYDFDSMIEEYIRDNQCTRDEAIEFIEYNTLRVLPYDTDAPIIMDGLMLRRYEYENK